jgi:Ca2+-binding EF-hand superfamily protein
VKFVNEHFVPYLKALYSDLLMRSSNPNHLDKVTFIEYTKLPGIINDRLHFMFSNFKSQNISPDTSPKAKLQTQKKEDFVTESSFIKNFVKLFIGDLDSKMHFTFEMYDFDSDGHITPEDVRIMMSYMPFNRNIPVQNVQSLLEQKGMENLNSSPGLRLNRAKQREGMYQEEEGKNVDYKDRISDQEEIKQFTESVFSAQNGIYSNQMNHKQYEAINHNLSSEMFYSLMAILHERLPCSQMYFKMRKDFKEQRCKANYSSPVR